MFSIGSISDRITTKTVVIFLLQFLLVILLLGYRSWQDSSAECVKCHGDRNTMEALGYPQFFMTQEMVGKESGHKNVKCHECHLGNGRATDPAKAHKGMLSALLIDEEGKVLERKAVYPMPLLPSGKDRIREMLPKIEEEGELMTHPLVRNLLWHDRNRETLNFDPAIAEKTCAKPACHPQELSQFKHTTMAANFRQRTMKTWLEPYGPHNCGPSFADLPPGKVLKEAGFSFENTQKIANDLNIPFSKEQAMTKQRLCNVCHVGCLDCHYEPSREKGVHHFTNKPSSESCAGYGRGTSICHPGAMQSRRGETYIGGDYSIPTGMKPDVHYEKGIHCVDCHPAGEKGMGDMQRKASCQDCHIEIEEALGRSVHKDLDCATCHISELRGYQLTIWGPGTIGEEKNPFNKYSLYYGIQKPPIIMKDQKGKWMPVKVWPHSVGNIKSEVKPSEKLLFRWPNYETRDAYYIEGTFKAPSNNNHLLWMEIEQASHPYGKARSCASCHGPKQEAQSRWEFMDAQGVEEEFKGSHRIVADAKSLRIEGLKNTTPIKLSEGYKLEDFASWLFFRDKWVVPGDFSIRTEQEKYRKYYDLSLRIEKELAILESQSKGMDKKGVRRIKELKGILLHNQEGSIESLRDFRRKTHQP
ncbi:MAG: cytochrome c3 family protein [Nitrospirales bacterium]|nr:cytochrome c3 family protein [Nitrospirales bacterium]